MLNFVLRRTGSAVVLMFLASILCFVLVASAPGRVAILIAEARFPGASAAEIERIEQELGLDQPLPIRYAHWLGQALTGDLDVSFRTRQDVTDELLERLPVTALLVGGAGAVALVLGVGLGVGATVAGGTTDRVFRGFALIGASTPNFFVAALLILVFAVTLDWLPSLGLRGPASWLMPCFTLALIPGAVLSRVVRVSLEEAMAKPYALTARSKGFGRTRILLIDALPNVFPRLITAFGTQFALMVQGAMVVEPIFAWQGIGTYFVEAVRFRDFPVVQACLLLFAFFFIVVNLLVDVVAAYTDPRQRRALRA